MNSLFLFLVFGAGLLLGAGLVWFYYRNRAVSAKSLAEELYRTGEDERRRNLESVLEGVKASFGSLSLEALSKSTDEFMKLAKSRLESERELTGRELEGKKELIDRELKRVGEELGRVTGLVQSLEKDRIAKFGELSEQLKLTGEQTRNLLTTTQSLKEVLASTKARGQWGERMAEDVLRTAGFLENVNYIKQKRIENRGTFPDFTFLLPRDLKVNMDVKFPLTNYVRYLDSQNDADRERCKSDFLRDVRVLFKQVTTRDYIDPVQGTVDYMILFIPNEQIYAFIHEQDPELLDEGLRQKVIFCSPVTLFAILAVIRQAIDNFALEKTSNEILSLLGAFYRQWSEFVKKLDGVGKRIDDAQKEYAALMTTRRHQLEKPLARIDELRTRRNLPVSDLPMLEENSDG